MSATDVFVIGGGPAGLAAAIAARQQGLRVLVADGAKPPIDKCCGEALMPDALAALDRLGVTMPGDFSTVRGVRFLSSELSADASFPSGYRGASVRRIVLHRILIERAEEVGVELLWQKTVNGIDGESVHVADNVIRAKWIVGADGVNSRVRRWAGLDSHSSTGLRYSFRRHYRVRPWTDRMEIYWGKESQGYITAVSDQEVCVAVASRRPHYRLDESLSEFPQLSQHLHGAGITSAERGAVAASRTLKRAWRRNVALIGDASGTVDAITGQGLGLAFHQALAIAACLKRGSLAGYETAHRDLASRPLFMARLMLMLDGRPRFQRRTLQVLRRRPEIFRGLLAFHVGAHSPLDLAVHGLTLGWGLLTA
jgi:flavin-dependent dehydrogenase